jgi:hypothetical protein
LVAFKIEVGMEKEEEVEVVITTFEIKEEVETMIIEFVIKL